MDDNQPNTPIILTIGINDPSGCAGVQADIETMGALGCHPAPVLAGMSAEHTRDKSKLWPCPQQWMIEQTQAVLEEMPVSAIKLGHLGATENIEAIAKLLEHYAHIPIIIDPEIIEGSTQQPIESHMIQATEELLMPMAKICCVNKDEARFFAQGSDTIDACAQNLMACEADYVLISDTQYNEKHYFNTLYTNFRKIESFKWPRLNQRFAGAGSTLSAAIAALIAQGLPMQSAVHQAQQFTFECLKQHYRFSQHHALPNRYHWARDTFAYNAIKKTH